MSSSGERQRHRNRAPKGQVGFRYRCGSKHRPTPSSFREAPWDKRHTLSRKCHMHYVSKSELVTTRDRDEHALAMFPVIRKLIVARALLRNKKYYGNFVATH